MLIFCHNICIYFPTPIHVPSEHIFEEKKSDEVDMLSCSNEIAPCSVYT